MEDEKKLAAKIADDMKRLIRSLLDDLASAWPYVDDVTRKKIQSRLNDPLQFWETFAEVECAAVLARGGVSEITIEPFYPKRGPDISARLSDRTVYFEVKVPFGAQRDRNLFRALSHIAMSLSQDDAEEYKRVHVHLSDAFPFNAWGEVAKTAKDVLSKVANDPFYETWLYLGPRRWYVRRAWSPLALLEGTSGVTDTWVRRNWYWECPVALWPTWLHAFESHGQNEAVKALGLIAVSNDLSSGDPPRTCAIGGQKHGLERQKVLRKRVMKAREQLPRGSPGIVIVDVSRVLLADELDVVAGVFGAEYARSCLCYTLGVEGHVLDKTKCICPSRVSALIVYRKMGARQPMARIYSNPNAEIPLSDSEWTALMMELPWDARRGDEAGSFPDHILVLPDKRKELPQYISTVLNLERRRVIHMINMDDIAKGIEFRIWLQRDLTGARQ